PRTPSSARARLTAASTAPRQGVESSKPPDEHTNVKSGRGATSCTGSRSPAFDSFAGTARRGDKVPRPVAALASAQVYEYGPPAPVLTARVAASEDPPRSPDYE